MSRLAKIIVAIALFIIVGLAVASVVHLKATVVADWPAGGVHVV